MTKIVHKVPFTVGEVLDRVKNAKTKSERATLLKDNDSLALRSILRLNFDPKIKFSIPEGFPPEYKPSNKPVGLGETNLKSAVKSFYLFVKESSPKVKQSKRESIFTQLLEQLDPLEARFLVEAKDKKLDIGLTKKLIDEVFPGLLPVEAKSAKTNSGEVDETKSPDKGV